MSLPRPSLSKEIPGRKENLQSYTNILNKYDINVLTRIFFVRRKTWKKRTFSVTSYMNNTHAEQIQLQFPYQDFPRQKKYLKEKKIHE
jgi:hypothetical protein